MPHVSITGTHVSLHVYYTVHPNCTYPQPPRTAIQSIYTVIIKTRVGKFYLL